MAKKKYTQIEIKQKKGSQGLMTGGNTELFIDGKKMTSATKVSFEVASNGVAKVNVELLGQVAVSGKIGQYTKTTAKIQTE
jgi:hypothetical protein